APRVGPAPPPQPHGSGAAGRGREVQRGGPVVRLGSGAGREPQVEHEPDRLGVAVVGGVGQDPGILGGEPVGQVRVGGENRRGGGAVGAAAGGQQLIGGRQRRAGAVAREQVRDLVLPGPDSLLVGGAAVQARPIGVGAPLQQQPDYFRARFQIDSGGQRRDRRLLLVRVAEEAGLPPMVWGG